MNTKAEVAKAFQPVNKLSPGQAQRMANITKLYKELGEELIENLPAGADRGSALRKLLDSKTTAMQAISHGISPEEALVKKS